MHAGFDASVNRDDGKRREERRDGWREGGKERKEACTDIFRALTWALSNIIKHKKLRRTWRDEGGRDKRKEEWSEKGGKSGEEKWKVAFDVLAPVYT